MVALLTVSGGAVAGADEGQPERLGGADASATPAADVPVMLPDLGITHRLANGGFNLFRMPLSDLELGYGDVSLVRTLSTGGFSYDRSRTIAGDFGNLTAGDDGTADHLIWHAASDGTVRLWAVAGGSDTAPRLWQTLRAPWSWANSRPIAGDVTGDGYDDLMVRLYRGCNGATCYVDDYVFPSNGHGLGSPRRWYQEQTASDGLTATRHLLADVDNDGRKDWLIVRPDAGGGFTVDRRLSTGTGFGAQAQLWTATSPGWSYSGSRQLAGDVTGDGLADLVTIRQSGASGLAAWVHPSEGGTPLLWQDLSSGGWSWSGSRQHLADTNGDYILDLISVHRAGGSGLLVWRHVSTGSAFSTPEAVADLRSTGWNWTISRESVADTWGLMTV